MGGEALVRRVVRSAHPTNNFVPKTVRQIKLYLTVYNN